jgi:hypothetical protein
MAKFTISDNVYYEWRRMATEKKASSIVRDLKRMQRDLQGVLKELEEALEWAVEFEGKARRGSNVESLADLAKGIEVKIVGMVRDLGSAALALRRQPTGAEREAQARRESR